MQEVEADCLVTLAVAEATDSRLQVLAQLVCMLLQICRTTPRLRFTKVDTHDVQRSNTATRPASSGVKGWTPRQGRPRVTLVPWIPYSFLAVSECSNMLPYLYHTL